jgi:PAP2 superfamily/Dockerin type I domain
MKLGFEQLESRNVMASAWQNVDNPLDTDGSGIVEPIDLLLVINDLRARGTRTLGEKPAEHIGPLCDVNGDGLLEPLDLLLVINALKKYEGEQSLDVDFDDRLDPNHNGVVLSSTVRYFGTTMKDSTVEVWHGEAGVKQKLAQLQASNDGTFAYEFDLPTKVGTLTFVSKDKLGRKLETERIMRHGDIVAEWNATLLRLARESTSTAPNAPDVLIKPPPPMVARNLAIVHLAMFDAINAFEQKYHSYAWRTKAPAGASPEAAISAAAHQAAISIFNDAFAKADLDATMNESLANIPNNAAKESGLAFGRQVADAVLQLRSDDGAGKTVSYQPGSEPGAWNRTPPTMTGPTLPQWPQVTPFVMLSGSQFRPAPPPALNSFEYAQAVDEVMRLGASNSSERTADQTNIAKFWADGAGTATPPGHWNQIAVDQSLAHGQSLLESARTLALVNLALADAGIASWNAKYHYDLWRPIDAIRKADIDGNSATAQNVGWTPLLQTPAFQSYTSGHSTFSHAAAAVLTSLFGDNVAFTDHADPGHTGLWPPSDDTSSIPRRTFAGFRQAAEEAGRSRIYGGIHFSFDNTAGSTAGNQIGELTVSERLRPV